jgi:UV DNA damage repair endonuclease
MRKPSFSFTLLPLNLNKPAKSVRMGLLVTNNVYIKEYESIDQRGFTMKLSYACINLTLPTQKTCRLKTVEASGLCKVKDLDLHNLSEVLRSVKWNADHGILMYRI